jgi:hypothetical protein
MLIVAGCHSGKPYGAMCKSNDDCASGLCFTLHQQGQCECRNDSDCPSKQQKCQLSVDTGRMCFPLTPPVDAPSD